MTPMAVLELMPVAAPVAAPVAVPVEITLGIPVAASLVVMVRVVDGMAMADADWPRYQVCDRVVCNFQVCNLVRTLLSARANGVSAITRCR